MSEPFYSREYDYPGEWDSEPPEWYPGDEDDAELCDRLADDDDPSEPEDWRHGEPAGDEGWS